ncbi:MAG: ribonuclease P protein component [Clostridioides sp.]|nr:ribonuclease P protein component [Clostridioides sp.]
MIQGIKKDSDFRKVYKFGKSYSNKYLVLYFLKNNTDTTRLGISISKKVGKANVRNKIRRRIKEVFRLNIVDKILRGYDIVFIARVAASEATYEDIRKSMNFLIKKLGLKITSRKNI